MKNWMKVSASAAFAAIGSIVLGTNAYGQEMFERIPSNCIIRADEVIVNDQLFKSVGLMDLSPGESFPSEDNRPAWMQLLNDKFSAKSEDPVLGTVTWDLDCSRPVTTSLIQANKADQLFPATVRLDFNVVATISSLPDRVFLSRTPVSIGNGEIMSWPPGETQLNSVDADGDGKPDEVEFFDRESGKTVFIVNRLRSWVRD